MTEIPTLGRRTSQRPAEAVISAIASHENCAPVDLTPPLFERIDTEALNKLFREFGTATGQPTTVSLTLYDHDVELYGDGRVVVDGTEYTPAGPGGTSPATEADDD